MRLSEEVSELAGIRELEGVAGRAWPARVVKRLGGWLLRAADGITRRANSVLPLGEPSKTNLEDAIEVVHRFYAKQKLPPRFQMTHASAPKELDNILAKYDFEVEMHILVQTAHLDALDTHLATHDRGFHVDIHSAPPKGWFDAYAVSAGYDASSIEVRKTIMAQVPLQKAYAEAVIDGAIVGVGFGVIEGEWLGLFSVTTINKYQRRGVATAISCNLAQWAQLNGASKAYLQVTQGNSPAIALYHRLGFKELYKYWYRLLTK